MLQDECPLDRHPPLGQVAPAFNALGVCRRRQTSSAFTWDSHAAQQGSAVFYVQAEWGGDCREAILLKIKPVSPLRKEKDWGGVGVGEAFVLC